MNNPMDKKTLSLFLLPAAALACLWPGISPAMALGMGLFLTVSCGNPYGAATRKYTSLLLSVSVVGLGAGMNLITVLHTGAAGIGYTVISIAGCVALGLALGRMLKTDGEASLLITVGTAICGGSAIAAVAPAIHAKHHNISAALAVVFCLNALALLIFPYVGHFFNLSQSQFGLWAALAIHDTSSVVGASAKYGAESLQIATTVKLARALWIVPLVIAIQALYHAGHKQDGRQTEGQQPPKRKYPWFILGFLGMAALATFVPQLAETAKAVEFTAHRLLTLTLFFIGANLSRETLKAVGLKPMLQGTILWIIITLTTLLAILTGTLAI